MRNLQHFPPKSISICPPPPVVTYHPLAVVRLMERYRLSPNMAAAVAHLAGLGSPSEGGQ